MDRLWQDLRYGLRTWSKAPGFTIIVVLTLAFGIGANTTMFAVINTLFLNPLPVTRPSELVIVRTVNRGSEAAGGDALPISHPNLVDLRDRNTVFQSVSGHSAPMAFTTLRGNAPERIFGELVTGTYGSIGEPPRACVYVPMQQQFSDAAILYIRTESDPGSVLMTAQRHIRELDARIEAGDARTIRTLIGQSLFGATIGVGLLGVFGLVALGLASLGLYGAMAHAVRQRQREIGVRLALGAERSTVIRLVLGQGIAVVGAGIAVGLAASLLVGRALAGVLFGVTPADPMSLGGASLILLLTAVAACYLPARRASRLDPVQALREA
jgi:ABC-type antimicrobial peptide transport system permease subunit